MREIYFTQLDELNRLISVSKMKADPDSTYTKESLLTLYKNAFPDLPNPPMNGKEWKDLGFQVCFFVPLDHQSENPYSDLRSGGKLSLENIVYFSDHYQAMFAVRYATEMYLQKMVKEAHDYPFVASAINLTTLLLIHLRISTQFTFCPCCGTSFKQEKRVPAKEMVAFASLLQDCSGETVFNELYSLSVMLMDHNYWKHVETEPTFTILEFRKVFVDTKEQIMAILRKSPRTITDVFDIAKVYLDKQKTVLCLLFNFIWRWKCVRGIWIV